MTMLENSLEFLKKNFVDLLIICSVGIVFSMLIEPSMVDTSNQSQMAENFGLSDIFIWLALVVVNTFIMGCICFYTHNQVHFKQPITPIQSFKIVIMKAVRVLSVSVAYMLAVYTPALIALAYIFTTGADINSADMGTLELMLILLSALATIFLALKLFFMVYVYLLEKKTLIQACQTSWSLTKGAVLTIISGLILIGLLQAILFLLVEMVIKPKVVDIEFLAAGILAIVETFGLLLMTLFSYHLYYHQHTK